MESRLNKSQGDKQLIIFLLSIIICCMTCVIASFFDYDYDDTNMIITFLLGVFVTGLYSGIFLFLLITLTMFGYYLFAIIIILIYHWINPSLEIYLAENKFLIFFNKQFGKLIDFEQPGKSVIFFRMIVTTCFYLLFYYLVGPSIYGTN